MKQSTPSRALLIGMMVDIGGSFLWSILAWILYILILTLSGHTQSELAKIAATVPPLDSAYTLISTMGGLLCSVLGGYVCGRLVGHQELLYGLILALINHVGILLVALLFGDLPSYPPMIMMVLIILSCAATIQGAAFAKKMNRALKN